MSEHKLTDKTENEKPVNGIVTSDSKTGGGRSWKRIFKWLLPVILVAALAVAAGLWYNSYSQDQEEQKELHKQSQNLGDDYPTLSKDEVRVKMQAAGLESSKIELGDLSGISTFDQAYTAAQSLTVLNKQQLSLKAYALAEQKVGNSADESFYLNYAEVANYQGNNKLWKQQINKALQAVKRDDSLDERAKQDEIKRLESASRLKELGW